MVRRPEPISWMDEIVAYFESDKPGQKKWFTRKMNQLPTDQQEEVWAALSARGHQRPEEIDPNKPTRTIITWTDEEWDTLTELVWNARRDDPTETIVGLCKVVMDKFPENRRRNIRVIAEIKPLVDRLTKRDQAAAEDLEFHKLHCEELQRQVDGLKEEKKQILSKDEILGTLTDDEVLNHYRERVLGLIPPDDLLRQYSPDMLLAYIPLPDAAAHLAKSTMEVFMDNQRDLLGAVKELAVAMRQQSQPTKAKPSMPMPRPHGQRLAKVTIVGLLGVQQEKVQKRLEGRASFNFVDKNRKPDQSAIPDGQDIILLAANFISHSMQEVAKKKVSGTATKLIVHHGGVDTLVRKLDAALPQLVFA